MTTIDNAGPASPVVLARIGRLAVGIVAATAAILRVIAHEIVYIVREDSYHGRIRRGED
jgi:hypothetical protein